MNGKTGRESGFGFDCCLLWETNAVFCDCSDRTLLGAGVMSQRARAQLCRGLIGLSRVGSGGEVEGNRTWLGLGEGEVEVVAADGRACPRTLHGFVEVAFWVVGMSMLSY